jgi:hypothetical protein
MELQQLPFVEFDEDNVSICKTSWNEVQIVDEFLKDHLLVVLHL